MKFSEIIESYLDDIRNFGDDREIVLCESFFNKNKNLLLESSDVDLFLKIGSDSEKKIMEDFKLYIDNIQ